MEVAISACAGMAFGKADGIDPDYFARIIALQDSDMQARLDEFKKQGENSNICEFL
ncbi:MAG TPA: hypothetical protein VKP78_06980 [bacterium]|nr:hypothetical protein [bacterium]